MGISENDRFRLHRKLDEVLGTQEASTMMELFPPRDWTDFARRSDIENLRIEMRAELIAMRSDISSLRTDFDALRTEFQGEVDGLRGEFNGLRVEFNGLRGEFNGLRDEFGELRADMGGLRAEFDSFKTSMILATVASAVSAWGLLLAALALR